MITTTPIFVIDGLQVHEMMSAAFAWLKRHAAIVDTLNVFPVPDGDTGANMVLTMKSALNESSKHRSDDAGAVFQALAGGAIRGARGNSGVILSQILRGMAEPLRETNLLDAEHLAAALRQGQQTAYKGVMKPVEGTILTVIREAAGAAGHAAAINGDLVFVLETTLAKAQQAVANTPNLLPTLKQAGVVDAGGQGLCYLIEGMTKYVRDGWTGEGDQSEAVSQPVASTPDLAQLAQDEWGYDIQFLVYGSPLDETAIRQRLVEMGGDSIVVGASGSVTKVHVHGNDPGPFLSFGATLGHLDDIVLENMTLQTLRRKGEWQDDAPASPAPPLSAIPAECAAIVAVVSGDGMQRVFADLGVCAIVAGGQSMNPSAEELLVAIESLPHPEVLVLPNNKNIVLAARQAAELTRDKVVHVVETTSMPQGVAAMFGYDADAGGEQNARAMTQAAQRIHSAEITVAVRRAALNGVEVEVGDFIGLIDGKLTCKASSLSDVVSQVFAQLAGRNEMELFTLYYGEPVSEAEAAMLAAEVSAAYPDHDVELIRGGQPHYHYLISAE